MGIYQLLVSGYYQIMSAFPPALQWLLTLALLVGVVVIFWHLIRSNILFLLLLVVLLPFFLPIVWRFFADIWSFIVFLWGQAGARTPQ